MSAQDLARPTTNSSVWPKNECTSRNWLLRRICSQNPFYLISVCFVLHGTARWFHAESRVAFSPWPLLWLTAGYTLLLAITGFVIVRFGKVWDDARSILLIILLMFVELSLIFDDTLTRDPINGRWLLLTCWGFSIVLSEALLIGLQIRLPLLFRIPYHGLLALLFLYPFWLVPIGTRLPEVIAQWRIFLFPVIASIIILTLIPAIRKGSGFMRQNGTPWQWPWYPWSLFVFLGVCIGFRAYALSLSFDPVLGESYLSALGFSSAFGVYFLVPIIFVIGLLLLEIGIVENRNGVIRLAMCVPLLCVYLSIPAEVASGPYHGFVRLLVGHTGSPVWLALLGAVLFYGIATIRRIPMGEQMLAIVLLAMSRVGSQTVDLVTLSQLQSWPLITLVVGELWVGLRRSDSHRVFVALCLAIATTHFITTSMQPNSFVARIAIVSTLLTVAILIVGGFYRDDFAWLLRLIGAPVLVIGFMVGCGYLREAANNLPLWTGPLFVIAITIVGMIYASVVRMPIYRLASLICGLTGSLTLTEMSVAYLIRESGWRGASSFVMGIACLAFAISISSWKAGWLNHVRPWLQEMLVIQLPNTA